MKCYQKSLICIMFFYETCILYGSIVIFNQLLQLIFSFIWDQCGILHLPNYILYRIWLLMWLPLLDKIMLLFFLLVNLQKVNRKLIFLFYKLIYCLLFKPNSLYKQFNVQLFVFMIKRTFKNKTILFFKI